MPILNLSQREFESQYFNMAMGFANKTIADQVKNNGPINPRIDVNLVKSIAVTRALDSVYEKFDVSKVNPTNQKPLEAFIFRTVHNAVLSELAKEGTAVGVKVKRGLEAIAATGKGYRFSEPLESEKHYYDARKEKKSDTLKKINDFMHKLKERDQIIIALWQADPKNYVDNALEEFGWEDTKSNRDKIYRFFCRAKTALKRMMTDASYVYRDGAIYSFKNADSSYGYGQKFNIDVNAARRRRRTVYNERTQGINYAAVCETLYAEIVKES